VSRVYEGFAVFMICTVVAFIASAACDVLTR